MNKKRWIAVLAAAVLAFGSIQAVTAQELPHAVWALLDGYAAAGGDADVIQYGTQIINLLEAEPKTDQIREILASKYYDVADAYDRQGNFPVAAEYYRGYLPYGEFMGWDDGVRIAKAKMTQYTPTAELYTESSQPQCYFGARNEPEMGVLYGQVAESMFQGEAEQESMTLLYVDYGNALSDWDRSVLEKARQQDAAVEIAWNFPAEAASLADIPNQGDYIRAFLTSLNEWQGVPVFLRIGAEMNVWTNAPDPAQYRAAYQFIASLVRQVSPQIATVWSVSHASGWNVKMEDFYPGDEYVDWVGISAYMIRYFQGREWPVSERFNEVLFSSGDAADPVMLVREVIEKFGGRKPIMLAECGSAHNTLSLGIDSSDWAAVNLRRMYHFVPMVYPQVKLIAYFNHYYQGEAQDYSLSDSPALQSAFDAATQAPHFIQRSCQNRAAVSYQKVTDGMRISGGQMTVYTYPHVFGDAEPAVTYYIDGNYAGASAVLPYRQQLDLSGYAEGPHTLRVAVASNGAEVTAAEYSITTAAPIRIIVNGSPLATDVNPVTEQDRTLVPLRAIFEALGADVDWDEQTSTAKAVRSEISISIRIDETQLIKNGTAITLEVPARLISGRTMVPVRAISEALGAQVGWDEATHTVSITS